MVGFGLGVSPCLTISTGSALKYTADVSGYSTGSLPVSNTDPFVADTVAARPTYVASGAGGDPCLDFDGVDDGLGSSSFGAILQSHSFTLNFDVEFQDLTKFNTIIYASPSVGSGYLWLTSLSNGRFRVFARNSSNATIASVDLGTDGVGGTGFLANTRYAISISLHDNVLDYWVDGIQIATDVAFDLSSQDITYDNFDLGQAATNFADMRLYAWEVVPV